MMKTNTQNFEGEDYKNLKFPILKDNEKYAVFFNNSEFIVSEMNFDEKKQYMELLDTFENIKQASKFWDKKVMEYFS